MSDDSGYAVFADPYCYSGTHVFRNILGLRDQAALDRFETAITAQRAQEPLPSGRFSVSHYRAIHRHLFQDVYRWAGRFRTVRIAKEGSMFCYPEHIAGEMRRLFGGLRSGNYLRDLDADAFTVQFAHFLAELNAAMAGRSSYSPPCLPIRRGIRWFWDACGAKPSLPQ